jgi:hypothetical protein
METYEGMRRQAEEALASKTARLADPYSEELARRFESKEEQLEYERIVREYYSLLTRAKASLGCRCTM